MSPIVLTHHEWRLSPLKLLHLEASYVFFKFPSLPQALLQAAVKKAAKMLVCKSCDVHDVRGGGGDANNGDAGEIQRKTVVVVMAMRSIDEPWPF